MDSLQMFADCFIYVCYVGAVVVIAKLFSMVYSVANPSNTGIERFEGEESFNDPISNTKTLFPSITESASVDLSVIVPAYNEEQRLPLMLNEALDFLENRVKDSPSYKYEIIVVSDGSRDNTVKVVESFTKKYGSEKVRCLELVKNRGKGGAVRLGVLSSRGSKILFADADGASKFEDISKLEESLHNLIEGKSTVQKEKEDDILAIAIGSRAHLEKESLATRSTFRNILMYGFHFLVWLFTVRNIKDTQCGFKLFSRPAANVCFNNLHVTGWAFDAELLYIAQKLNIPIAEIPVRWTEIDGSKVTPVISWIQMGFDLGLIWLKHKLGVWNIDVKKFKNLNTHKPNESPTKKSE